MISFPFTQLCFHLHHGNPSTFDQSILIPSHPSSFHLHFILHSSASISITGIPPPGGLLSAAPKPWEQVIVYLSIDKNNLSIMKKDGPMITQIEGCNYLRGSILHSIGTWGGSRCNVLDFQHQEEVRQKDCIIFFFFYWEGHLIAYILQIDICDFSGKATSPSWERQRTSCKTSKLDWPSTNDLSCLCFLSYLNSKICTAPTTCLASVSFVILTLDFV